MIAQVGFSKQTQAGKLLSCCRWSAEEVIGVALFTLLVVVVATAAFAIVVIGIKASEKRAGLPGPPQGRADAFARRILCAQVQSVPILSQRTARMAGKPGSGL